MQIILRKRQMGKTTELIRISAETFAYIVVPTRKDAGTVSEMAKDMGLDIPFPLTYDEFIRGQYYGKNIKGFLIDNADMLLQYMAKGVAIKAISLNDNAT